MNRRLIGSLGLLALLAVGLGIQRFWLSAHQNPAGGAVASARGPKGPMKLSDAGQWQRVPEYLVGATILGNDDPESVQLQHVVKNDGVLLLAASWMYDGNRNDETWSEKYQTVAQVRQDGWVPIGKMNDANGERYYIFRRNVHAGEQIKIQTRLKTPDLLLTVPEADVAKVMQVEPLAPEGRKTLLEFRTAADAPDFSDGRAVPGTVSLHTSEPDQSFGRYSRLGLMLREIVVQGVSLAGREEFGLPTRDNSLRELAEGSDGAKLPLEVMAISQPLNELLFGVFQEHDGKWEAIYDDELRFPADNLYERITATIEAQSRNELVAALKKAGFEQHERPKARDTAEVPADAIKFSESLNIPAQFAALRVLHAEISEHGESPELLCALARSYALLGVLTDHLWSPASRTFHARSLLYAQRAVSLWPKLALPLYSRAYARGLVGLHRTALDDYAAAAKISKEAGSEPPEWSSIIDAYCRFDAAALEAAAKQPSQEAFVRLLQLLSAELSTTQSSMVASSRALLEADHESLRAIDGIANLQEIGLQRYMAETGPMIAAQSLLTQVRAVPDLPEPVTKALDEGSSGHGGLLASLFGVKTSDEMATRLKVINALREAGAEDTHEPCLAQLATLLEEIDFLHAWRQVDVAATKLGLPADEIVVNTMLQVEHHPYAKLIESYRSDPPGAQQAIEQLPKTINIGLLYRMEDPMLWRLYEKKPDWGKEHFPTGSYFHDGIASDLVAVTSRSTEPERSAKRLRDVSPDLPFGIVMGLSFKLDGLREQKKELEEKYTSSAPVLTMLGQVYEHDQQWDDAIRCFKASVKLDPSSVVYKALAQIYLTKGDEDQWLATLEEFLNTEQYGLGPAQVRVNIADHFIAKGDWKRARPYADAAAESYSAWSLLKAGQCAEALQDWTAAEQWYEAVSRRYENQVWVWYLYCRRTGKGDQEEALRVALPQVRRMEMYGNDDERYRAGVIRALNKQPQEAAVIFDELYGRSSTPFLGLCAVLANDEAGDQKTRDRIMAAMHERNKNDLGGQQLAYAELVQLICGDSGDLHKTEPEKLEEIVTDATDAQRADLFYLIGWYLERVGQKDEAVGFWKRCLQERDTNPCYAARTLASASLLDRGITMDEKPADKKD